VNLSEEIQFKEGGIYSKVLAERHFSCMLRKPRPFYFIDTNSKPIPEDDVDAITEKKNSVSKIASLFSPNSIAVIGASRNPGTVGYAMADNLIRGGFKGPLYFVNPKAAEICGLSCFNSVEAVPGEFDLAVIIVPPAAAAETMRACGKKGARAAIVITAGFREIGDEGRKREDELLAAARDYGISLLGPNCLGLINTDPENLVNASFARAMPAAGNIAFVSQSGALCTAALDYAKVLMSFGSPVNDENEYNFL
jgi:acyl-CoA synthetase (NDP forming)